MLVVVALGGNALLKRGEPLTAEAQRRNVTVAAQALAQLVRAGHHLVVTHGNGPQVGLLALQGAAYKPDEAFPLDVLGAQTEGMIGYLIEQELENALAHDRPVATLLTQVLVDRADPAFLQRAPDVEQLWRRGNAMVRPAVGLRNLYPPRVSGLPSATRVLCSWGWEESGLPREWVNSFNDELNLITTVSRYVAELLVANGVRVPIAVVGNGVEQIVQVVGIIRLLALKGLKIRSPVGAGITRITQRNVTAACGQSQRCSKQRSQQVKIEFGWQTS